MQGCKYQISDLPFMTLLFNEHHIVCILAPAKIQLKCKNCRVCFENTNHILAHTRQNPIKIVEFV